MGGRLCSLDWELGAGCRMVFGGGRDGPGFRPGMGARGWWVVGVRRVPFGRRCLGCGGCWVGLRVFGGQVGWLMLVGIG